MNFKSRYIITADNRQAKQAFREIDDLRNKGIRGVSGSSSGFGDILGGNLAADAISRLTSRLYEGGQAVFDYTSRLEQTKVSFNTLMGGADAAAVHIKELQALSRSTPLQFDSIATMSKRLQGAGVEAKRVVPLIEDIGNIAAATGDMTAERMEGIGVAISQIFSKGKLSAEEAEQLAERSIPVWRILSQELGKSTAEVRKLAEQGKISADIAVQAFSRFSRANFGDAMEKQAKTFTGSVGMITNILLQTANTAFQPLYEEISQFSATVARSLKEQEAEGKKAGVSFGKALGEGVGEGIGGWFSGSGGIGIATGNPVADFILGGVVDVSKAAFNFGYDFAEGFDKGRKAYASGMKQASVSAGANLPTDPLALSPGTVDPKDIEKRRKEAERLAERDLAAATRLEEINLQTVYNSVGNRLEQLRNQLASGSGINEFSHAAVKALADFDRGLAGSIEFLEELENRSLAGLTVHEKALLLATQSQRKEEAKLRVQEEVLKNQEALSARWQADEQANEAAFDFVIRMTAKRLEIEQEILRVRKEQTDALVLANAPVAGMAPEGPGPGFSDGLFGADGLNIIRDEAMQIGQIYNDLGMMVGDTIGQMIQGVGSLVEAWVLYGDLGPNAVRKMTASILAGLAAQAAVKAIFQLAEGFAALFFNPAEAAAHFKAAALYGAVAIGAGLAGRAIAGDSFKEGGSGGGSSSAGASRSTSGNQTPISRQNENTFISSRPVYERESMAALARSVEKLEAKITGMRPGDVLTAGIEKKPGLIGKTVVNDIGRNAAIGTGLRRVTGGR